MECLKWTDRWLIGFKKRHLIKEKRRYNKRVDAQFDDDSKKIKEDIREEAKTYPADCIYNINKTGKYCHGHKTKVWNTSKSRSIMTILS